MLKNTIVLLRPRQWIKNSVVFAGLIFSGPAISKDLLSPAILAAGAFCLLSSAVYAFNDIMDFRRDRLHPIKRNRPIPAGKLSVFSAAVIALVLTAIGLILAFLVNLDLLAIVIIYLLLNVLYSVVLKNIVIIDVMIIAIGFVLRALAGNVAIGVQFSSWLLIATFMLALFLSLGKRRHELVILESGASGHRKILEKYSAYLLDQLIGIVTASTVITYLFYTLSAEIRAKFQTDYLFITIPFVIYGIFRYLYLIHKEQRGGSPTRVLLNDLPLLFNILLWLITVIIIIYI